MRDVGVALERQRWSVGRQGGCVVTNVKTHPGSDADLHQGESNRVLEVLIDLKYARTAMRSNEVHINKSLEGLRYDVDLLRLCDETTPPGAVQRIRDSLSEQLTELGCPPTYAQTKQEEIQEDVEGYKRATATEPARIAILPAEATSSAARASAATKKLAASVVEYAATIWRIFTAPNP